MTREEKVMKLLQEEFGIHNEHELDLAIANMEKVNISVFVKEVPHAGYGEAMKYSPLWCPKRREESENVRTED